MTPDTLSVVPNTPGTTRRTVRIGAEVWDPAKRIARAEGTDLSTVIRDALARYIADHEEAR